MVAGLYIFVERTQEHVLESMHDLGNGRGHTWVIWGQKENGESV